jgi:hypothetical protein
MVIYNTCSQVNQCMLITHLPICRNSHKSYSILNIISESCFTLLKFAIADHHNYTIRLQVTHKTFVTHFWILSVYIGISDLVSYHSVLWSKSIYTSIPLALSCCKYVIDSVFLLLHLGFHKLQAHFQEIAKLVDDYTQLMYTDRTWSRHGLV